jgi:hypothetical protein
MKTQRDVLLIAWVKDEAGNLSITDIVECYTKHANKFIGRWLRDPAIYKISAGRPERPLHEARSMQSLVIRHA